LSKHNPQPTRVALVTGANRGIGRAIAVQLAADGMFVVGSATSSEGVNKIRNALGDKGMGVELRLEESNSVENALKCIEESCQSPSVLVNNAGVARDDLLIRMSMENWDEVVSTNLSGIYRVTKPLLRKMIRARWGRIVNISSVVARMGNPGQTNYAASKAGIEGFTRALAMEVGSRGVTVNAISPGFIQTEMTETLTEEQSATMLARIPIGRFGTVDDVANAVSFLVSERASYVTGETLHVNGGLHMS